MSYSILCVNFIYYFFFLVSGKPGDIFEIQHTFFKLGKVK